MFPEQPVFIVDASDEVSSQIAQSFAKAEIRNAIEHFKTMEGCQERLQTCSKLDGRKTQLCPVLVLVSAGFLSQLSTMEKLLREDDRFASVPLVLHGTSEQLPQTPPEGVRSMLTIPPRLEKIVQMIGKSGAQWILRPGD